MASNSDARGPIDYGLIPYDLYVEQLRKNHRNKYVGPTELS